MSTAVFVRHCICQLCVIKVIVRNYSRIYIDGFNVAVLKQVVAVPPLLSPLRIQKTISCYTQILNKMLAKQNLSSTMKRNIWHAF